MFKLRTATWDINGDEVEFRELKGHDTSVPTIKTSRNMFGNYASVDSRSGITAASLAMIEVSVITRDQVMRDGRS
jgi:hypothetical protein